MAGTPGHRQKRYFTQDERSGDLWGVSGAVEELPGEDGERDLWGQKRLVFRITKPFVLCYSSVEKRCHEIIKI